MAIIRLPMKVGCKLNQMKNTILIIFSILLLASCSPQRRIHRLVSKHPELSRVDTIKIQDTVIVPGPKIDTAFHASVLKDTLIITKEKLQIRLLKIKDTIYLDAEVEPDTVILTKEIFVDRIVHIESEKYFSKIWKKSKTFLPVFLILFVLCLSIFITKKQIRL